MGSPQLRLMNHGKDSSGALSLGGEHNHLVFPRSGQVSRLLGFGPLIPEFDPSSDLLALELYELDTLPGELLQSLVT